MLDIVTETSFLTKDGDYRKFNIQILSDKENKMIVINLNGYGIYKKGINFFTFEENKKLFFKHLKLMFGLDLNSITDLFLIESDKIYYYYYYYYKTNLNALTTISEKSFRDIYNKFLKNRNKYEKK